MIHTKKQIKEKKESLSLEVEDIIDHLEHILHEARCDFMYTSDLESAISKLKEWTMINEDGEDYYY